MNKSRWFLLLSALPIVFAARQCLNYHEISVSELVESASGEVFAIVKEEGTGVNQLWAWSADLKNRRTLVRSPWTNPSNGLTGLACNSTGDCLVYSVNRLIVAIDPQTSQPLWQVKHMPKWSNSVASVFFNDEKQLMVLGHNKSGWFGQPTAILDVATGEQIISFDQPILRLIASQDFLAVQCGEKHLRDGKLTARRGSWDVYQIVENEIELIDTVAFSALDRMPNPRKLDLDISASSMPKDAVGAVKPSRTFVAPKTIVELADASLPTQLIKVDGNQRHRTRLSTLGRGETHILLLAVVVASVVWAWLLVYDGAKSEWTYRVVVDAVLLVCFLSAISIQWNGMGLPGFFEANALSFFVAERGGLFPGTFSALACGLVVVAGFCSLMHWQEPVVYWTACFVGCVMLPIGASVLVVAILIANGSRFGRQLDENSERSPKPRKRLRFRINEMMLLTAGVALLIGMGRYTYQLIPAGLIVTGCILFSIVLAGFMHWRPVTWIAFVFTWVYSASSSALQETHSLTFMATIMLGFAFLAMYGYSIHTDEAPKAAEPALGAIESAEPSAEAW